MPISAQTYLIKKPKRRQLRKHRKKEKFDETKRLGWTAKLFKKKTKQNKAYERKNKKNMILHALILTRKKLLNNLSTGTKRNRNRDRRKKFADVARPRPGTAFFNAQHYYPNVIISRREGTLQKFAKLMNGEHKILKTPLSRKKNWRVR